jgi:lysophospholipase L1-like esterase
MRRWQAAGLAVLGVFALACEGTGAADPKPSGSTKGFPSSMAALGDSITAGYASCLSLSACLRNSWATGDGILVDSHYRRILAGNPAIKGNARNYATAGATAADLAGQAAAAVKFTPAYLTVMIGANDACRSTIDGMTGTSAFAERIGAALATVKAASPRTRILMVSIPDVYRVWELGHTSRLATSVWSVGVCPSLLANPTSTATADVARRKLFRDRIDAYDGLLAQACAGYGPRCRWDGGAVHRTAFGLNELSALDFFHPNSSGQGVIARLTYPSTFTW